MRENKKRNKLKHCGVTGIQKERRTQMDTTNDPVDVWKKQKENCYMKR